MEDLQGIKDPDAVIIGEICEYFGTELVCGCNLEFPVQISRLGARDEKRKLFIGDPFDCLQLPTHLVGDSKSLLLLDAIPFGRW